MPLKVLLYKTATCIWCHKTEEFFKKNNVKYTVKDVGEDEKAAEEMIDKSGQRGVPVIDVNGIIITGFNEPELKKALNLK